MTVQEMIDNLATMPRDASVVIYDASFSKWFVARWPMRMKLWDVGHGTYMPAKFDGKMQSPLADVVVIEAK